jgi:zinc protease
MKYIIILGLIISSQIATASKIDSNIHKLDWNGIEVTWLEDNRFPTYEALIYFADGALSDGSKKGVTNAMFTLLTSGTRRFSQRDIADNLEFFGSSYGGNVTHETSTYAISGLTKDLTPTMKKVCHIFKDASFPKHEIRKAIKLARSSKGSIVNDPSAVASLSFRELSLKGTPYSYPVGGKLKDLKNLTQKNLKSKLDYFNTKVKKRIYLAGPKSVLNIKDIIVKDCGWSGKTANFQREVNYKTQSKKKTPKIFLVTVPKANQAQIRFGRFLNKGEYANDAEVSLSAGYLGGGFTSKLMREIRVKRGLSYTASAFAGGQRQYGRSVISTFTKVSTVDQLLDVVKNVLNGVASGDLPDQEFKQAQGSLAGSIPFRFETHSAYLKQLLFLDDQEKPYSELYSFSKRVKNITKEKLVSRISKLFSWDNQTIVVVGPKSLTKKLQKFGKVNVMSYKKFL